jgi:hypothetical protein
MGATRLSHYSPRAAYLMRKRSHLACGTHGKPSPSRHWCIEKWFTSTTTWPDGATHGLSPLATADEGNLQGGAHCCNLHFWFSYIWSPKAGCRANLPKKHPDKIHIDFLEFQFSCRQQSLGSRQRCLVPRRELSWTDTLHPHPSVPYQQHVHQMLGKETFLILGCWLPKVSLLC